MAITNAQQYKQLMQNGGRIGLKGGGSDASTTSFSKSYDSYNPGSNTASRANKTVDARQAAGQAQADATNDRISQSNLGKIQTANNAEAIAFAQSIAADNERTAKRKRRLEEAALNKKNLFNKLGFIQRTKDENLEDLGAIDSRGLKIGKFEVPSFITGAASAFKIDPSTKYFDEDSIREIGGVLSKSKTGITATQADTLADLREDIQYEDRVLDPDDNVTQSEFTDYMNRNKVDLPDNDGGNEQQQTDPCLGPNPPAYCNVGGDDDTEEEVIPDRNLGGLAPRFAGSIFDFTGMADGGRAGAMDGGRMMNNDNPEGGIMDLESGRQMYFLGKLVKKVTRGVKKIAKSPVGKMALLGLGAGMAGFGPASGLFSGGKGLAFKQMLMGGKTLSPSMGFKSKGLLGSVLDYAKSNPYRTIGGLTALTGLMTPKEEEENNDDYYKTQGINIADIRNNPYNYTAPRFAADGGIMRLGYAEGSEEPVAKKTMPLLDMEGQEMDLREEGGFVPLGRMERADDVPARLSKNEFVFTADAVRNAGEGDVDKGAEVMYNMMKNLESGGDVSQESQGLEGAREMFQTSQRLEEVI